MELRISLSDGRYPSISQLKISRPGKTNWLWNVTVETRRMILYVSKLSLKDTYI